MGGISAVTRALHASTTAAAGALRNPLSGTALDRVSLLLLALFVALLLVVALRWRAAAKAPGVEMDEFVDATRLLTAANDLRQVGEVFVAQAQRFVPDAQVTLIERSRGILTLRAASEPARVTDDHLAAPPVREAVHRGNRANVVFEDPPLGCSGGRFAFVVAPVRSETSLLAAYARDESHPFTAEEVAVMQRLALLTAAAYGSATEQERAHALADVDPLTQVHNRRRLDRDLGALDRARIGALRAHGYVMLDVDHFKHYNDTNGHQAGDEVLRTLAGLVRSSIRANDDVYRYGGEEFVVMVRDAGFDETARVAERIRRTVEEHDFPGAAGQPDGRLTVSIGAVVSARSSAVDALGLADAALYEAKSGGRNRVVLADVAER